MLLELSSVPTPSRDYKTEQGQTDLNKGTGISHSTLPCEVQVVSTIVSNHAVDMCGTHTAHGPHHRIPEWARVSNRENIETALPLCACGRKVKEKITDTNYEKENGHLCPPKACKSNKESKGEREGIADQEGGVVRVEQVAEYHCHKIAQCHQHNVSSLKRCE